MKTRPRILVSFSIFFLGLCSVILWDNAHQFRRQEESKQIPVNFRSSQNDLAPQTPRTHVNKRPSMAEKRRKRQEAEEALEASIVETAQKTGLSTNEVYRQWEMQANPERLKLLEEIARNDQRDEGLATGGLSTDLWEREEELARLSAQLQVGMGLVETEALLGKPYRAVTRVVTNGFANNAVAVSLESLPEFQGDFTLVYSPNPKTDVQGMGQLWRILRVSFDRDHKVTGWAYTKPVGTW